MNCSRRLSQIFYSLKMTRYSSSSLAIHPIICTLTLYRYKPSH
nr:MAG TPA: hypothetical protein [Bacteriophage sp.]